MTDLGLVYVFVRDMDRSIEFYEDVFDLERGFRAGNDWTDLLAGDVRVGLHGVESADEWRPGGTLCFTVGSLDDRIRSLAQRGIPILHDGGGGDRPRFVEFADPDGNMLGFIEAMGGR
jgi:catechol 2,3-dioxygenase-like lactoylglutathione lyase family enzyme